MRVAENLTDPSRDLVLGGVGMVATRRTAELHRASLNQSLTMTSTPVFIRTSQSDELRKEESVFMKANYLPLADDCWILGRLLPKGGGEFELLHPGRYRISSLEGSDLAGTYPEGFKGLITPEVEGRIEGTLDGVTLRTEVVELLAGKHRLECPSKCVPIVLWVGPKLNRIHKIGSGDHRYLFVQAY